MTDLVTKKGGFQKARIKFFDTSEVAKKLMGDEYPNGYIAGWASTPDLDHYSDIIRSGAFDESIRERGLGGPEGVKLLIQHKADQPAGVIEVLETREGRLWIEARLNLNISYVNDYYEAAKTNGGMNFSVGFMPTEGIEDEKSGVTEFTKGDLFEVSLVTFPGNRHAHMLHVKEAPSEPVTLDTLSAFEKALVADQVVETRNAANMITRLVKQNAHLFAPAPAAVVQESHDESLSNIRKSLSGLRDALKPTKEDNRVH